jgi:hypothetical protein
MAQGGHGARHRIGLPPARSLRTAQHAGVPCVRAPILRDVPDAEATYCSYRAVLIVVVFATFRPVYEMAMNDPVPPVGSDHRTAPEVARVYLDLLVFLVGVFGFCIISWWGAAILRLWWADGSGIRFEDLKLVLYAYLFSFIVLNFNSLLIIIVFVFVTMIIIDLTLVIFIIVSFFDGFFN